MTKNFTMEGTAYWCKLLDDPVPTYDEKGEEWTLDVSLSERGKNLMTRLGMIDKIKNQDDDRGEYVTFRRPSVKKSGDDKGQPNKPVPVKDAEGNDWDNDTKIGNGSKVKVKFSVFSMPARGKFKAFSKLVLHEVTVLELKEYAKKKPQEAAPAAEQKIKRPRATEEEADWEGE